MVFKTVALSVITLLLLFLLCSRKAGKIKFLLSLLSAACSAASLVCFVLMQKSSGNPDVGKEGFQLYIPCAIYVLVILFSGICAALSRKKIRLDKAAKMVAKNKGAVSKNSESQ